LTDQLHASVGDHDVKAAESIEGRDEEPINVGYLGDVGLHADCGAASRSIAATVSFARFSPPE